MAKQNIYFMGFLANTNSSILRVKLGHNFKIEKVGRDEGIRLISNLENSSFFNMYKKLISRYRLGLESQFYIITNSFEVNLNVNSKGRIKSNPPKIYEFMNEFVQNYLYSTIKLMRLFKEGGISLPIEYLFYDKDNPKRIISLYKIPVVSLGRLNYILTPSEVSELQKFIQNTKLPFERSFLQLAFEAYELSYKTHNKMLSFLSLMSGLESLFNPGGGELKYRISRNTAVLLGKDKKDSKGIFFNVKTLYEKRSKTLHTGKTDIGQNDVLRLRHYVRGSIKEIYKINKNKNELLDILNSLGFGEKVK